MYFWHSIENYSIRDYKLPGPPWPGIDKASLSNNFNVGHSCKKKIPKWIFKYKIVPHSFSIGWSQLASGLIDLFIIKGNKPFVIFLYKTNHILIWIFALFLPILALMVLIQFIRSPKNWYPPFKTHNPMSGPLLTSRQIFLASLSILKIQRHKIIIY